MFYKIDPRREQMLFDLGAEGFLIGDRVWMDLRGDFQPTPRGSTATDTFSNTSFELGGVAVAATPTVVRARGTGLRAINHDDPLGDNSDPDNDYGVLVRLDPFTPGDDVFRFAGRTTLPQVQGSIYRAGAGDDVVVMPSAPVAGFNHRRTFQAGPGDDLIRAGTLELEVNFGAGEDTFFLKGARVAWGDRENRDNDASLVVTTADGHRHSLRNAEILAERGSQTPLVKWYFDIDPAEDGRLTIGFYENGRLVREGRGFYDEALPVFEGAYQASFRMGAAKGELIRLDGGGGRPDVLIHRGADGGGAEADLLASRAFLKAVFRHIDATYADLGQEPAWRKGFAPLVPATAAVGDTDQPFLRARDLAAEDRRTSVVAPRFKLEEDGDARGLEAKSVQIFFKVEGTATRGVDWDFADGTRRFNGRNDFADAVLRQGRDGDGDMVYSVMLDAGARAVTVPIEIFRDRIAEGRETVEIEIVDLDLWAERGSRDVLYRLSGGPGADRESDLDGRFGREADLIPDRELVIAIHDDLIA